MSHDFSKKIYDNKSLQIQMNQNKLFSQREGNAWFSRNASQIQTIEQAKKTAEVHFFLETLKPFSQDISRVLEIGCSNGIKLEAICSELCANGVGVEPSPEAVRLGNARQKDVNITLHVGTGDHLDFKSQQFDIVYFAFCLYLFDRSLLIQSLSEADRVLKPGGFLVITDFDPSFHHKRPYIHHEGIFSYKNDYSNFYTQTGLYNLIGKKSFSHNKMYFDKSPDHRIATNVLYKEIDPYPTRE